MEIPLLDGPLAPELTLAMRDVLAGTPASDAWLEYVRQRHGEALDVLARVALSEMALDLLEQTGHLPHEDAIRLLGDAVDTASSDLSLDVWHEIRQAHATLDRLEALLATSEGSSVVLLPDRAPPRPVRSA